MLHAVPFMLISKATRQSIIAQESLNDTSQPFHSTHMHILQSRNDIAAEEFEWLMLLRKLWPLAAKS
jgi:hypothetical protein